MDSGIGSSSGAGVLVLPPSVGEGVWRVVEVDAAFIPEDATGGPPAETFPTPTRALSAAFDVLTILEEGRIPAMHEHVQESVRDFVRALEARGYDRESALKVLIDMVDRRASHPPKPIRSGRTHNH